MSGYLYIYTRCLLCVSTCVYTHARGRACVCIYTCVPAFIQGLSCLCFTAAIRLWHNIGMFMFHFETHCSAEEIFAGDRFWCISFSTLTQRRHCSHNRWVSRHLGFRFGICVIRELKHDGAESCVHRPQHSSLNFLVRSVTLSLLKLYLDLWECCDHFHDTWRKLHGGHLQWQTWNNEAALWLAIWLKILLPFYSLLYLIISISLPHGTM